MHKMIHVCSCMQVRLLIFSCSPRLVKCKLLIFFCDCRVIPQVTTVKPSCCCVVVMMHKSCRPLCLGQIPWLPSQRQLCGTRAQSVPFGTQFRTNYKSMTFQINRRISCPIVKMLCIAQNYLIQISAFWHLYFLKCVKDLE